LAVNKAHSSDHEPPFAIYVRLLLFEKIRKRNLIDLLFQHGICISYDRVLEITTTVGDAVIQKYLEDCVVCPSVLHKGVFTTSAVDNIYHNPSSTTAMTFHGAGIYVLQHPSEMSTVEKYIPPLLAKKSLSKKVSNLPESYTNI
jgi:hypothetical protein